MLRNKLGKLEDIEIDSDDSLHKECVRLGAVKDKHCGCTKGRMP